MCVSISLDVHVRFSDTILYMAEMLHPHSTWFKRKTVHVLGYENTVQNDLNNVGHSGNAMLLPLPAVPGTITQKNCISTESFPHILQDYRLAVKELFINKTLKINIRGSNELQAEIFDSGIYTVVLAQNVMAIPLALEQVPLEKRPILNSKLFEMYSKWYPSWTFALCCFNNKQAARATPLLWWYEPLDPTQLFAPGLDCHTGAIPDLNAEVEVNHTIVVGSYWQKKKSSKAIAEVKFQDKIPKEIAPYLLSKVTGGQFRSRYIPNGDFVLDVKSVRNPREDEPFRIRRSLPPGGTVPNFRFFEKKFECF